MNYKKKEYIMRYGNFYWNYSVIFCVYFIDLNISMLWNKKNKYNFKIQGYTNFEIINYIQKVIKNATIAFKVCQKINLD